MCVDVIRCLHAIVFDLPIDRPFRIHCFSNFFAPSYFRATPFSFNDAVYIT